jgi:Tfp pilus assembly protein FimT
MATAELGNFFSSVMAEVVGGLVVAGLLASLAAPRLKLWLKHRRIKL